MSREQLIKWGGWAVLFLVLANIISYFYSSWDLITVKVHEVPLNQVIRSIEWQGWVKIYTNLPTDQKVSMYVDHVPLAEAMETLAANVSGPPNGAPADGGQGDRPRDGAPPGGQAGGTGGGGPPGGQGGGPGGGGPPGGRSGRGDRGGVQWNLAFFVAPTSAEVKQEISAFESGTPGDDTKVYTYSTPFQMVLGDDAAIADPRRQAWPGYKAPDPSAAAPATTPDGQTAAAAAPAAPTTPTIQTYLQAFAESANIWIMTPGTWASDVSTAPAANSSIIRAVKNFVSNTHGAVTEAIVLRMGRGAHGGNHGGGFGDMEATADRMRNAANGLSADDRAAALEQIDQEVQFFQTVRAAPPDQQMQMVRDHMAQKARNGMGRMSPEKRAARYAKAVSNRETAQGKK